MKAPPAVDYDKLEEFLRALAHARRLELLHLLRLPHELHDIRLAPGRSRAGERPERAVARQSIQAHLEKLVEIGVVMGRGPGERGRRGKEFVVNPQRAYQIAEEFRRVITLTAGAPVSRDATVEAAAASGPALAEGPQLVLVHGFEEGKAFPLRRTDLEGEGGWVIGRKPGLHVSLEYDPFVSLVNSEITLERDAYLLSDLGSSKNGTWLNWRPLGRERARLKPGDVIGVGRSLLVFRRE